MSRSERTICYVLFFAATALSGRRSGSYSHKLRAGLISPVSGAACAAHVPMAAAPALPAPPAEKKKKEELKGEHTSMRHLLAGALARSTTAGTAPVLGTLARSLLSSPPPVGPARRYAPLWA